MFLINTFMQILPIRTFKMSHIYHRLPVFKLLFHYLFSYYSIILNILNFGHIDGQNYILIRQKNNTASLSPMRPLLFCNCNNKYCNYFPLFAPLKCTLSSLQVTHIGYKMVSVKDPY